MDDFKKIDIESGACEYVAGYVLRQLFCRVTDVRECDVCVLSLTASTQQLSPFFVFKTYSKVNAGLQSPSVEIVCLFKCWDGVVATCYKITTKTINLLKFSCLRSKNSPIENRKSHHQKSFVNIVQIEFFIYSNAFSFSRTH